MDIYFANIGVDILPIALIALTALSAVQYRRNRSLPYIVCFFLFGVYLVFALKEVFFPIHISGNYADAMKELPEKVNLNSVPFFTKPWQVLPARVRLDHINNVLLTIPFGFGLPFVSRATRKDYLWLPLAVGLGLEGAQLALSLLLGYAYRVVDINDVILNAAGVAIGFGLLSIISWLFSKSTRRYINNPNGWLSFIRDVSRRIR